MINDTELIENIYIGDETTVKCRVAFYKLLVSGIPVTPNRILAKIAEKDWMCFDSLNLDEELPECLRKYRIKQKQIMSPMYETLKHYVGDSIERKSIGNHKYEYVYNGMDKDPLREMKLTAVQKDIEEFRQFCMDSAYFFPKSWMGYFFKNTKELFDINRKNERGESCILVSLDREYENIDLLPLIYVKIKEQKIIEFDYRHKYGRDLEHRIIHPQFLHEFNGRWHMFGYEEGNQDKIANIALDRIVGDIVDSKVKNRYVPAELGYYQNYFKNIIGVTHGIPEYDDLQYTIAQDMIVRAHGEYMYGLIKSKPIHNSQNILKKFDDECGYGEFILHLELNNELIGRILQMGPGLEVMSPPLYREEFSKRVGMMAENYNIV